MSASSDEEISNVGGIRRRGCQGGADDDGDEDDDDPSRGDRGIGKKQHGGASCGFRKDIGKAKRVVLRQFAKAKNRLRRRRIERVILLPSSSGDAIAGSGEMIRGDGTRTGCKFCFSRPRVLESPNGSPTSDPNDPNFTQAMLKALIEKNDFRSKECNPHLD